MAWPSVTWSQLLPAGVRQELEQFAALLQGYLSTQHKDDGSHSDFTADSLLVTGDAVIDGTLTAGHTTGTSLNAPGTFTPSLITLDASFGSGAGWTFGSGKWTHGAGFTALTSTWTPTIGVTYRVVITTVDWTGPAGGITLSLGGVVMGAITDNVTSVTYYVTATSAAAFTATPTPDTYGTTYNGAISGLSIAAMTGGTVSAPLATFGQIALGNGRVSWNSTAHEVYLGYGAGGLGSYGTALGYNAGNGSTGVQTNFIGLNAGEGSTGNHNNGIGSHALQDSTGPHSNAHGLYALYNNTGDYGSAFGDYAGINNTGDYLVAVGRNAGDANTGNGVTVVGDQAGYQNTGVSATAVGEGAGYQNTGGNIALVGQNAGYQNTGLGLVALGSFAGYGNQGAGMMSLGYQAGYGATPTNRPVTDTYGILIGYQANRSVASATVLTNYIGIGNGVLIGASNQVVIGNGSITVTKLFGTLEWGGGAAIPNSSDVVLKGTAPTLTGTNFTGIPAAAVNSGTFAGSAQAVFGGALAIGAGSTLALNGAGGNTNFVEVSGVALDTTVDGTVMTRMYPTGVGHTWYGTAGATMMTLSMAGALRMHAYGAGTLTTDASGNVTAVSDARYKDRIAPLGYGLAEVLKLSPVRHGYTELSGLDTSGEYGGFLAQDVQAVMPLAVGENPHGYLTLSDRPILGAAVVAIQELHARIEALEARLAALEGR